MQSVRLRFGNLMLVGYLYMMRRAMRAFDGFFKLVQRQMN
jgi:hypothetical protein